jgi:hypothetical protein
VIPVRTLTGAAVKEEISSSLIGYIKLNAINSAKILAWFIAF